MSSGQEYCSCISSRDLRIIVGRGQACPRCEGIIPFSSISADSIESDHIYEELITPPIQLPPSGPEEPPEIPRPESPWSSFELSSNSLTTVQKPYTHKQRQKERDQKENLTLSQGITENLMSTNHNIKIEQNSNYSSDNDSDDYSEYTEPNSVGIINMKNNRENINEEPMRNRKFEKRYCNQ
jgi:hypothetical protein